MLNRILIAAVLLGLAALQTTACAATILFVGNSFTFGGESPPVQSYRPETVTDLNHEGMGGVPALFKAFTREAGLAYDVYLETASGMNLDFHYEQKAALISRAWDHVVVQGYSTLDADAPGDAGKIIEYSARLAQMFHAANPRVDVRLVATWSRADQTYLASGHWFGKPIETHGDRRARRVRPGGRALFIHPRRDTGRPGLEPGHRRRNRGTAIPIRASAPIRSISGPQTATMRACTATISRRS